MDAGPLLSEIGRRLREVDLDAVLIGNAAAALQGAPVTTVDFDFMFRKTPRNLTRLKALARGLRATIIELGGVPVRVASLADIIRSKRAAGRPRDLAVLDVLETALEESPKPPRPPRRARARKSS